MTAGSSCRAALGCSRRSPAMSRLPARLPSALAVSLAMLPLTVAAVRSQSPLQASIRCIGSQLYDTDAGRNCVAIAAGHTGLVLHADGSLATWGDRGVGVPPWWLVPVPQLPAGMSWLEIVAAAGSALALRTPALLGLQFRQQAIVFDASMANAF